MNQNWKYPAQLYNKRNSNGYLQRILSKNAKKNPKWWFTSKIARLTENIFGLENLSENETCWTFLTLDNSFSRIEDIWTFQMYSSFIEMYMKLIF